MKRPKILLIDDDIDHLIVCRIIFEKENYEVLASAGYASFEVLLTDVTQFGPNLIYVDHEMPGIHGGYIIRQLRSHPPTANIPIVYLSAHASIDHLAEQYGADGYLSKPYDIEDLLQVTRHHLVREAA